MYRFFFVISVFCIVMAGCTKDAKVPEVTTIDASAISMYYDETSELKILYQPTDAVPPISYTFKSSDEYVAVVDDKGVVSGVHVGECVITITTDKGISTECEITINPKSTLYKDPCLVREGSKADVKAYEVRKLEIETDNMLLYSGENANVDMIAYFFENGKLDECYVYLATIEYCIVEGYAFLDERYNYFGSSSDYDFYKGKNNLIAAFALDDDLGLYIAYFYDSSAKSSSTRLKRGEINRSELYEQITN